MWCKISNNKKVNFIILVTIFFVALGVSHFLQSKPNEFGWDEEINYISFDRSMQMSKYTQSISNTKKGVGVDGVDLYLALRKLYAKNNLSKIKPSETLRIPKIIHVIWINGKIQDCSVPKELKKYIDTWKDMHPDWEYKLWTDADVEKIKLHNQDLYDDAKNFGMKSDILRYEIVYKYGGVYVDTDLECLKPLDRLHYTYDFYIGTEPLDSRFLQIGSAILGARPGHPVLKHIIQTMRTSYKKHKGAPDQTGPKHFTRAFFDIIDTLGPNDIVFPCSYFYPLGVRDKNIDRDRWKNMGAYAVHWWGKTWLPAEYRQNEFKNIKNTGLIPDWY